MDIDLSPIEIAALRLFLANAHWADIYDTVKNDNALDRIEKKLKASINKPEKGVKPR